MIHRLEMFPASALMTHNPTKDFGMNPSTLIIVNSKTRLPPMHPGKKNHWPLGPKNATPPQGCPAKKAVVG